jgi:hypothetical protein
MEACGIEVDKPVFVLNLLKLSLTSDISGISQRWDALPSHVSLFRLQKLTVRLQRTINYF